jgi:TonB family protein
MKSHSLFVLLLATVLLEAVATTALSQIPPVASTTEKRQGIDLFKKGKIAEAEVILSKVTAENPADSEAWYFLGLAFLQKPNFRNAVRSFEKALQLNPKSPPAHIGLSYGYLGQNRLVAAIAEARTALSLDSLLPEAHYIIGVASLRSGALTEALDRANDALRLDPYLANAYLLKSQVFVALADKRSPAQQTVWSDTQLRDFDEAAAALEIFLQLNATKPSAKHWTEQLDALRFYVTSANEEKSDDKVFRSQGLTTKARVLKKPEPFYTEIARQNQIRGTVILNVVLAADGSVKHILIVKDLPHGMTERCVEAARQIQFEPAVVDGRPVSVLTRLEYNFNVF